MKKFKLFPFMLLPLALSSCGESKFLGTYSFQLGRDSGTHFGVYATVTNKDYISASTAIKYGKLMKLRLNLGGASVGGFLDDLNLNDVTINTFYTIGKELGQDKGNVFNFGFNIVEVLEQILPHDPSEPDQGQDNPIKTTRDGDTPSEGGEGDTPSEGGEGDDPFDPSEWANLGPEDTSKFVYSTISKTTLTFNIPVGFDDLTFQLYWYGLDLANPTSENPPDEHPAGTHPTATDVELINETYPASHDGKKFRDYHTLSLALTKK